MVDITAARWVGARHSCAAAVILQAWAAVSNMDVNGVVTSQQSKGLHENTFIISGFVVGHSAAPTL